MNGTAAYQAPDDIKGIRFPMVIMAITDIDGYREIIDLIRSKDTTHRVMTGDDAMTVFGTWW